MWKKLVATLACAVAVAVPTASAASPPPVPGTPSCGGLVVAQTNHNSGPFGPSGNPNASAGPGSFLGPDTHAAIAGVRAAEC
jgi:hypothetical protein